VEQVKHRDGNPERFKSSRSDAKDTGIVTELRARAQSTVRQKQYVPGKGLCAGDQFRRDFFEKRANGKRSAHNAIDIEGARPVFRIPLPRVLRQFVPQEVKPDITLGYNDNQLLIRLTAPAFSGVFFNAVNHLGQENFLSLDPGPLGQLRVALALAQFTEAHILGRVEEEEDRIGEDQVPSCRVIH